MQNQWISSDIPLEVTLNCMYKSKVMTAPSGINFEMYCDYL